MKRGIMDTLEEFEQSYAKRSGVTEFVKITPPLNNVKGE